MAYVMTGDLPTAQDLVQETLLRTWVRWSRISKYDDPLAWARHVLYNLAVSKRRSEGLRRSTTQEAQTIPPPNETHLMLASALRSLSKNQMRALVLHDGAGLSVKEVAADMKVAEGTVKAWLSRGRAAAAATMAVTGRQTEEGHAAY
jgi:RNA polymerase sigma-70 factor, ECF subfamily